MVKKLRTTINIDEELVLAVRSSGVRNISAYLASLIRNDLRSKSVDDAVVEKVEEEYTSLISDLEAEWQKLKI